MSETSVENTPSTFAVDTDAWSKRESLAAEIAMENLDQLSKNSRYAHKKLVRTITDAAASKPEGTDGAVTRLARYAGALTADGRPTDCSDIFLIPEECLTLEDTLQYLKSTRNGREDLALRGMNVITLTKHIKSDDKKAQRVLEELASRGSNQAKSVAIYQRQINDQLELYGASSDVSRSGGDTALSMLDTKGNNLCHKQENWRQEQFERSLQSIRSSNCPNVSDLFKVTTHLAYEMEDVELEPFRREEEDTIIRDRALLELAVLHGRLTANGDSKVGTVVADTVIN